MLYGVGTPLSQSGLPVVYKGFGNYNCTLSSRETMSPMMSLYFSYSGEAYRLIYGVHVTVHCLKTNYRKSRLRQFDGPVRVHTAREELIWTQTDHTWPSQHRTMSSH